MAIKCPRCLADVSVDPSQADERGRLKVECGSCGARFSIKVNRPSLKLGGKSGQRVRKRSRAAFDTSRGAASEVDLRVGRAKPPPLSAGGGLEDIDDSPSITGSGRLEEPLAPPQPEPTVASVTETPEPEQAPAPAARPALSAQPRLVGRVASEFLLLEGHLLSIGERTQGLLDNESGLESSPYASLYRKSLGSLAEQARQLGGELAGVQTQHVPINGASLRGGLLVVLESDVVSR